MTPQENDQQVVSLKEFINERFDNLNKKIDQYFHDNDETNGKVESRLRAIEDWKLTVNTTVGAYTGIAAAIGVIASILIKVFWR